MRALQLPVWHIRTPGCQWNVRIAALVSRQVVYDRWVSDPTAARPPQVRLALPSEAGDIAAIQRRAWDHDESPALRDWLLSSVDLADLTEVWHRSISRPPEARCRVLVALSGSDGTTADSVVGFATTQPGDDPDSDPAQDGEIAEWTIDPTARSTGHGSRLLNAAIDTLRADGFARVSVWVASTDDVRRRLLTESGWAPDGSHREIGPHEDLTIKQVRLHTSIEE